MSKQTRPDLKELFKQASEIAQQVPENMQEAAFNRALDLLTGNAQPGPVDKRTTLKNKTKVKAPPRIDNNAEESSIEELLDAIDSTQHSSITSGAKTLDLALMILQIALSNHKVDGLMPVQIAKILNDKFRINIKVSAVRMALARAANLVDRKKVGQGYMYRIMEPGEKHLTHLGEQDKSPPVSSKRKIKKAAKKKSKTKKASKESFSILKDLNFHGEGKSSSFKKFYEEKKPKSNLQFNVLAIYYLKKIMKIPKVTPDHIYTCYREVNRKPPNAFRQSLWDTSGSRFGYIDGADLNDLKIPHRGVTLVMHDLPAKKKGK